jgi:hypothetical protein
MSDKLTWHHKIIYILGQFTFRYYPTVDACMLQVVASFHRFRLKSCVPVALYVLHGTSFLRHWFDHHRNVWWMVQIIKVVIMTFPLDFCYFFCLKSQYFQEYHTLPSVCKYYEHHRHWPQLQFCTLCQVVLHRTYIRNLTPALRLCAFCPGCVFVSFFMILVITSDYLPTQLEWLLFVMEPQFILWNVGTESVE